MSIEMQSHNIVISANKKTEMFQNTVNENNDMLDTNNAATISGSIVTPDTNAVPKPQHTYENYKLEIAFQNLSYAVKTGIFKTETKTLLKGLTGKFCPGELSVILGPSGSGKSTLLHLLSAYKYTGYTGDILVNGKQRGLKTFKPNVAYIAQDTSLQSYLTVKELMNFAANLKLGNHMSADEIHERVKTVLLSFGIYENQYTQTESLSGGQRKRLTIALEVLNDSSVLILDEPTSGLDSSTANNCISLLKNLAKDGRTVICAIHQPSAFTFHMFDHMYAIAKGQCIYAGCTKKLVQFLSEVGLPCPEFYSPVDYLMEIAMDDYGEQNINLVTKMANGQNQQYRRRANQHKPTNDIFLPLSTSSALNSTLEINRLQISNLKNSLDYGVPISKQIFLLTMRTYIIYYRDPSLVISRFLIHAFIALLIGVLYYGIGNDANHVLNNFRYTFYSVMFIMYSTFSAMIVKFPLEIPIVARERFNRWYSLRSYFLALSFVDIPIQFICTCVYVLITYFLTAQPPELFRFVLFLFIIYLTGITAQSIGLAVGALMNVEMGSTMGTFIIAPFFAFSGFFLQYRDAPVYMRWMFHLSFLKYGLDGATLALFGYDRPQLECREIYCHYARPKFFLKDIDMENVDYGKAVIFLTTLLIIMRVLSYYIMHIRLQFFS